jgi:isocitrate/isopropylmalate dehydrogenase
VITIAWLPGDGVGREVTEGSIELLRSLEPSGSVRTTGPWPVGSMGFQQTGHVLPAETLAACVAADAVLLGAVGEDARVEKSRCPRPELALIGLRRELELDVSVREVLDPRTRTSTTVVRNLLGGAYLDDSKRQESDGIGPAWDMVELYPDKIAVVADIACDHAQRMRGRRLISVDKATLYATSRLWRRVVDEVSARRGLTFDHVYVDRAAFELAGRAELPGVVLTEGLFGDILSDLIAGRAGSPALCGSASIRPYAETGCRGLYEPAHGSAPRRAGQDRVNPAGGFLSLTMLLESFPSTAALGGAVRAGLEAALASGPHTYDLADPGQEVIGTRAFSELVTDQVRAGTGEQDR